MNRELSAWNDVFGVVYLASGLEKNGITPDDSLITIVTSDDVSVYSHGQFRRDESGEIHISERVVQIFNDVLRPAIDVDELDPYTATQLLLQTRGENRDMPSYADMITFAVKPEIAVTEIEKILRGTLARWNSGSF